MLSFQPSDRGLKLNLVFQCVIFPPSESSDHYELIELLMMDWSQLIHFRRPYWEAESMCLCASVLTRFPWMTSLLSSLFRVTLFNSDIWILCSLFQNCFQYMFSPTSVNKQCLTTHFLTQLRFLPPLPPSILKAFIFGLGATNSVMIFSSSSSFIRPVTFLLIPMGNGRLWL